MKTLLRSLALFAALLAGPALAQVQTQQSGTHIDAATQVCTYSPPRRLR